MKVAGLLTKSMTKSVRWRFLTTSAIVTAFGLATGENSPMVLVGVNLVCWARLTLITFYSTWSMYSKVSEPFRWLNKPIVALNQEPHHEMCSWLNATYGGKNWLALEGHRVILPTDEDATLFRLKWSKECL
jgi:hypothetical protein